MTYKALLYLGLLPSLIICALWAQGQETLEFEEFRLEELRVGGFELESEGEIAIYAVGGGDEDDRHHVTSAFDDPDHMFAYPWILNASTRELVWRLTLDNSDSYGRSGSLREYDGTVSLPAGRYEVYYLSSRPPEHDKEFPSLGDFLHWLLSGEDVEDEDELPYRLSIKKVHRVHTHRDVKRFQRDQTDRALVALTGLSDDEYESKRFLLKAPAVLDFYALGEAFDDDEYDYGWIQSDQSGKKIWVMREGRSEHAGGALKNRLWRKRLELEPGPYAVYFITDDSHSTYEWNANPPYDPSRWGVTVIGENEFIAELVETDVKPLQDTEFVRLTRVGDDRAVSEEFELGQTTQLRVRAVGEGDESEMYDYGWIADAHTGRKVWKMFYENTRHAGGAHKNRLAEEIVELPEGVYRVHYRTDDSHSYEDWNSGRPRHPEDWGITLYVSEEAYSAGTAKRIDYTPADAVVALVQVGNDEYVRKSFSIDSSTPLRIFAVGEGDGEMYDYGWIESDNNGHTVWKMSYDMTYHAGGAHKNRAVDEHIQLDPGQYTAFYRTDDSHAYNSWNSSPPDQPEKWGLSIMAASGGGSAVRVLTTEEKQELDYSGSLVRLTRIRDSEKRHQLLSVESGSKIRVVALGEGSGGRMSDYGWIVNIRTGETVWKMKHSRTQRAGGARKNRKADEVIYLPQGYYMVYYKTDGSHAYNDWNARAPHDPDLWGITLLSADSNSEVDSRLLNDPEQIDDVVCRLARMHNYQHMRRSFELDSRTSIYIYAIGEGSDGEMYDYAWIENAHTHEVVWLMEYNHTAHAGGARKNRVFSGNKTLPAGRYTLHYATDDSHTYRDWNSYPPDDPENYGVTIFRD